MIPFVEHYKAIAVGRCDVNVDYIGAVGHLELSGSVERLASVEAFGERMRRQLVDPLSGDLGCAGAVLARTSEMRLECCSLHGRRILQAGDLVRDGVVGKGRE